MKLVAIGVLAMLALGFIPVFALNVPLPAPISSSISTSTSNPCVSSLCGTLTPQNNTFNPSTIPNYFGTDIGKFSTVTDPQHFEWSTSANDFMLMSLPTVGASTVSNSIVYYNSTHTAYQFSGSYGSLSVFLKLSQYKVKISIHANLGSPQTVCLPFMASNPIVQNSFVNQTTHLTQFLPSARAGNEVFDWSDSKSFNPAFSSNTLCFSVPNGITNIDPLALDGMAELRSSVPGTVTIVVSLTTSTSPDVIMVNTMGFAGSISVADTSSLTWTQRATVTTAGTLVIVTWYAIASGTLTGDTITVTWTNAAGTKGLSVTAFGVSGANTASPFDSNAPVTNTGSGTAISVALTTTSTSNEMLLGFTRDESLAAGTTTVGSGFTQIGTSSNPSPCYDYNTCSEYKTVSSTGTYSITFTDAQSVAWGIIGDAIQGAITNQPYLLTLIVNPSPSPEGGGIPYSCTPVPVPCFSGATTTISSTSIFTLAAGLGMTITMQAVEFSGYIWNGWAGNTSLIHDTINPLQTATVAATMTTTQSATLTANFSSGGSLAVPALAIGGIIVGFLIIAMIAARRR